MDINGINETPLVTKVPPGDWREVRPAEKAKKKPDQTQPKKKTHFKPHFHVEAQRQRDISFYKQCRMKNLHRRHIPKRARLPPVLFWRSGGHSPHTPLCPTTGGGLRSLTLDPRGDLGVPRPVFFFIFQFAFIPAALHCLHC